MAVCCLHSRWKVTAVMSNRDKHADSISQLNGNRKSEIPFFLTEEYANKLLPTCPCGVPPCADPSLARAACGLPEQDGQSRDRTEPPRVARNTRTRQTC